MQSVRRALFFVISSVCCSLFSMENYTAIVDDITMSTPEQVVGSMINNCKEEDDFVLIERMPIEQLDLSSLDQAQSQQKNKTLGKGTLFLYDQRILEKAYKDFFGVENHALRTLVRYVPSTITKDTKPRVLFIVHGTSGHATPGYYDPETELFQSVLRYVAAQAEQEGVIYDVYSVLWSGENSDVARIRLGLFLGYILNVIKCWYGSLNFFAFSHGCNGALIAGNVLLGGYKIDEFIAVAPPYLEDNAWFYAPHNVLQFYPIISKDDFITTLGRFWSKSYNTSCKQWVRLCEKHTSDEPFDKQGKIFKSPCEKGGVVTNIHYTYDNYSPGHSELPGYFAKHLPELMKKIKSCFAKGSVVRNLSINIVPQEKCTKYSVEQLNMSLYPQNDQEEKLYALHLPLDMIYDSARYEHEHEKTYGFSKNYQPGYIYSFYYKITKIFK